VHAGRPIIVSRLRLPPLREEDAHQIFRPVLISCQPWSVLSPIFRSEAGASQGNKNVRVVHVYPKIFERIIVSLPRTRPAAGGGHVFGRLVVIHGGGGGQRGVARYRPAWCEA
jgi:hypothetical protein